MPRPRTKGPQICITLPLEVHEWLEEKAARQQLALRESIERMIIRQWDASTAGALEPAGVCDHKGARLTPGGMAICDQDGGCGKVRGKGGVWR